MNCVKKSVNKYIAALVAIVMAMTAFAVVADASDASTGIDSNSISASEFKDGKTGTLHIKVNNNDEVEDQITVTVSENGKTLAEADFVIYPDTHNVDLSFQLSKGTHDLSIQVKDKAGNITKASFALDVKKDVWSNLTTYLAIAFLAIIIIIIAVVYMRANPRNKPTTTFTELERQKNEAAAKAEEPEKPAKSTGKIKYESSRRK